MDLERILEQLPSRVSNEMMCRYLNIETCSQLSRNGHLRPDAIAEEYFHLREAPCWEDIVKHLCQDFRDKRLAKTVADTYSIPFSKYC